MSTIDTTGMTITGRGALPELGLVAFDLYRDILEASLHAAFDRHELVADADRFTERLRQTVWFDSDDDDDVRAGEPECAENPHRLGLELRAEHRIVFAGVTPLSSQGPPP